MSLTQFCLFSAGQSAVKATFLASAIRKCGGNEQKGSLLYSAYGSSGQVSVSNLAVLWTVLICTRIYKILATLPLNQPYY
jgi:hypothetical protein